MVSKSACFNLPFISTTYDLGPPYQNLYVEIIIAAVELSIRQYRVTGIDADEILLLRAASTPLQVAPRSQLLTVHAEMDASALQILNNEVFVLLFLSSSSETAILLLSLD